MGSQTVAGTAAQKADGERSGTPGFAFVVLLRSKSARSLYLTWHLSERTAGDLEVHKGKHESVQRDSPRTASNRYSVFEEVQLAVAVHS